MIMIAAVLNTLYGIAAIDKASIFTNNAKFVFADLKTFGWFVLALGVAQFFAALAIWRGTPWGRWFGVGCADDHAASGAVPTFPSESPARIAVTGRQNWKWYFDSKDAMSASAQPKLNMAKKRAFSDVESPWAEARSRQIRVYCATGCSIQKRPNSVCAAVRRLPTAAPYALISL